MNGTNTDSDDDKASETTDSFRGMRSGRGGTRGGRGGMRGGREGTRDGMEGQEVVAER